MSRSIVTLGLIFALFQQAYGQADSNQTPTESALDSSKRKQQYSVETKDRIESKIKVNSVQASRDWECSAFADNGQWGAYLPIPLSRDIDVNRALLEKMFPQLQGMPEHCQYKLDCTTYQLQPVSESDPQIIKRMKHNGLPAFLLADTGVTQSTIYRYVVNTPENTSVQVMLHIRSLSDVKACESDAYVDVLWRTGETLHFTPIFPIK